MRDEAEAIRPLEQGGRLVRVLFAGFLVVLFFLVGCADGDNQESPGRSLDGSGIEGLWEGACGSFTSLEFLEDGTAITNNAESLSYEIIDQARFELKSARESKVYRYSVEGDALTLADEVAGLPIECVLRRPGSPSPYSDAQRLALGRWVMSYRESGSDSCGVLFDKGSVSAISLLDGGAFIARGNLTVNTTFDFLDDNSMALEDGTEFTFEVLGDALILREPEGGSCEFTKA